MSSFWRNNKCLWWTNIIRNQSVSLSHIVFRKHQEMCARPTPYWPKGKKENTKMRVTPTYFSQCPAKAGLFISNDLPNLCCVFFQLRKNTTHDLHHNLHQPVHRKVSNMKENIHLSCKNIYIQDRNFAIKIGSYKQ